MWALHSSKLPDPMKLLTVPVSSSSVVSGMPAGRQGSDIALLFFILNINPSA